MIYAATSYNTEQAIPPLTSNDFNYYCAQSDTSMCATTPLAIVGYDGQGPSDLAKAGGWPSTAHVVGSSPGYLSLANNFTAFIHGPWIASSLTAAGIETAWNGHYISGFNMSGIVTPGSNCNNWTSSVVSDTFSSATPIAFLQDADYAVCNSIIQTIPLCGCMVV